MVEYLCKCMKDGLKYFDSARRVREVVYRFNFDKVIYKIYTRHRDLRLLFPRHGLRFRYNNFNPSMSIRNKSVLVKLFYNMGINYLAPSGLTYFWNFGSLALLSLVIQIVTGVFLAMYYTGHVDLAFDSVEHIMRDIKLGWFIRYTHANGASMFFAVVYLHMLRGLYFGSYYTPRHKLWVTGVLILFLMIGTAFMVMFYLGDK